jgi:hypothetical protein
MRFGYAVGQIRNCRKANPPMPALRDRSRPAPNVGERLDQQHAEAARLSFAG